MKTTSPFGGVRRTQFSGSHIRHSSPFFGRTYSTPCQAPCNNSFFFKPWFRPYTPPVVLYDNSPSVIVHDDSPRTTNTLSNTLVNILAVTSLAIITIALVNSALTRNQICTMGRDCNDVYDSTTRYFKTVCSDLYERCV